MPDAGPFILGVDLGKTADYTALVLTEPTRERLPRYDLTFIERVPLKTRYTEIAARVAEHVAELRSPVRYGIDPPEMTVVLDYTGVGIAVAEIFLAAGIGCPITLVTITGGQKVTNDGIWYGVPKGTLVSVVQRTLQEERLKIAEEDPHADLMTKELGDFQAVIHPSGHVTYGAAVDWRSGKHDDLVLAAALAVWWGEYRPPNWNDAIGDEDAVGFFRRAGVG